MADIPQSTRIDVREVHGRNRAAREIISALAEAMPSVAGLWFRVNAALTDTPTLLCEVDRLGSELIKARRDRANLVAAARAALRAERDAEPAPLNYVRDELRAQGHLPPEGRGRR